MSTIVLQHCQKVIVRGPGSPALIALALSFAGSGTIEITAEPNGIFPPGPALPGVAYAGTAADCTKLTLHYKKAEGGPESVSVDYAVTVL